MSPAGRWDSISKTVVFTGVRKKKTKKTPAGCYLAVAVPLIIGAKIQEGLN